MAVIKHRQRPEVLLLKSFNAGIFLSFGGLLSIIVAGGSPTLTGTDPGLVKLLAGFVFPVGLVMIVLQGQELLTSNMMVIPMGLMKRVIPLWSLPYNWIIVFFGNLAGSLFFASILSKYTQLVTVDPYLTYILENTVKKAVTPNFLEIFLRGIGCNWLVCIAVWQGVTAKDVLSKIVAIWFPIWIFVACGYDHVIANMFSLPLGILLGADLTAAEYIRKSLIASLLGNIVGALILAIPYTYFYLGDYHHAGKMQEMEEGSPRSGGSMIHDTMHSPGLTKEA